jgi:hypothetical protein
MDFMQRDSHHMALRRKQDWLEVCRPGGATWIRADMVLSKKTRIWLELYRQFEEADADKEGIWPRLHRLSKEGRFMRAQR